VWIFQDGHLGGLGTTTTGALVAGIPVLMFCIAFGLSMDYEVFLVSRIRERWLACAHTQPDNDESVAVGMARAGRVVTAAALVMSISLAALSAADVSIVRMFGVGLTLAIIMDATLIRMCLLPAFMHVLGTANWWAPAPLRRFHRSFARRGSPARSEATTEVIAIGYRQRRPGDRQTLRIRTRNLEPGDFPIEHDYPASETCPPLSGVAGAPRTALDRRQ
jgi:RND superfamily putative drug exporter